MAGDYIKCPRCELNYIHKSQGYCDVCKAELKLGPQLVFAVEDDDDDYATELCPICKQVYITEGEEMCAKCREEYEFKRDELDIDNDEEWKNYLDDDVNDVDNDEEMLSLSKLAEEEAGEMFEEEDEEEDEEEEESAEPDDFDIPEIDEKDFEEEEDDEEEEDEDDEEDNDNDEG